MKAYILGLPHRFRGDRLLSELQAADIESQVVFGEDGELFDRELLKQIYAPKRAQRILGRQMTQGEVACALGHATIYELAYKNQDDWALILEDDAWLTEDFQLNEVKLLTFATPLVVLLQGLPSIKNNSLAVRDQSRRSFSCLVYKVEDLSSTGEDFPVLNFMGVPQGCFGYLMNRAAIKVACENQSVIDSVADWPFSWRRRVRFVASYKQLVGVDLTDSILDENRKIHTIKLRSDLLSSHESSVKARMRTLIGLLGIYSFGSLMKGLGFYTHYLENVIYPLIVRRLNNGKHLKSD